VAENPEERPWRERMEPVEIPSTSEAIRARLEHLSEIQAHREWVIDGLRVHIENLQHDLGLARHRVDELDRHTKNVEDELVGVRAHAANLEERLAEREARLAEVEDHAVNLEQRIRGRRIVRLASEGIFPKATHPRVDALFRLGQQIWDERPDLQRRFPQDRAADFWYWLLWDMDRNPDVARLRFPTPDAHLRERVIGGQRSAEEYLRSGLVDWWRIDGTLRLGGFDPAQGGSLLDFGTGCGRIIQYFALYAAACRVVGCDVDPEALRWCAQQLDFAAFHTITAKPPTQFADASFDAVYGFSVFSHLSEPLHLAWLAELRRITRPGGVVVLTVHGRRVIDEIGSGRALAGTRTAAQMHALRPALESEGFGFVPYGELTFAHGANTSFFRTWDLELYGDAFILEPYVRRRWAEFFDVVAHIEAPEEWQDYVVLRRRS